MCVWMVASSKHTSPILPGLVVTIPVYVKSDADGVNPVPTLFVVIPPASVLLVLILIEPRDLTRLPSAVVLST